MNTWKKIALFSLLLSSITFVVLFGRIPAFRKGPIGALNRLLLTQIPAVLRGVDDRLTGGRLSASVGLAWHYLMNENHPLVLGFFLILIFVSQLLFLPAAFPYLSSFQRASALILSIIPYVLIYACVYSTSSAITPENHWQRMRQYPYDYVLFEPGQTCRTCHFLKPARSKHCSLCKACISKHDHHCIWVMNCLGKGNYGYFIAMLLSLSVMLTYGAWLGYGILAQFIRENVIDQPHTRNATEHWSTKLTWPQYFNLWNWALGQDPRIGAVGLLALLTSPLSWALLLYHVYLIWAGTTTNESAKWQELKDDIQDGLIHRSLDAEQSAHRQPRDPAIAPSVPWPAFSHQRLMRFGDGQPPSIGTSSESIQDNSEPICEPTEGVPQWTRVHGLHEIENLYDLGFWDNLKDIWPTT